MGSPPRVRGKVAMGFGHAGLCGITPARAGKSSKVLETIRRDWDHPRACGEKVAIKVENLMHKGSPPRVRGKAGHNGACGAFGRITPARAGKSPNIVEVQPCARDHPRACGEKRFRRERTLPRSGSPPRVRGKATSN